MKERSVDLIIAVFLLAFCLLMQTQLENIPREGVLFPLCVIWLTMGCSVLMAIQGFIAGSVELSFFGDIPPLRWCLVTGIFLVQVIGSLYLSFNLSMGIGMFATLCMLTPGRAPRTLLANAVFTVLFLLFFQIFFSNLMHIYFPEPFWD